MKLNLKLKLLKVNKISFLPKLLVFSCWFSLLDGKKVLSRKKRQTKGVIMPVQAVKAVIATAQLDQILYDKIMRKLEYTNSKIVNDYLDDFFILNLAKRLQPMFILTDHTKFPEQIGKAVSLATLKLTTVARCRMLYSTYPCETFIG